jgi:pimeloyl-ACP methyl ester carboxylesterase
MSNDTKVKPVKLKGGFAPNLVVSKGSGTPVVFLHGAFGPEWPDFLDDLAAGHRVIAPTSPGIDEPNDLALLDGFWDLVLYYDELFDALGLGQIDLVGHSFGGMLAAEIAATFPGRVRNLVLIDAMGLWLEELPMHDHLLVPDERRAQLLYHDPTVPEVSERLVFPDDLAAGQARTLRLFDSLGATSHFTHPIPERGLRKRLHRIRAKTLVLWGANDRLIPVEYGKAFEAQIAGATLEVVPGAGHYPYLEKREAVSKRVLEFFKR